MGQIYSSFVPDTPLDGSIDDIFRLIFMKNDYEILHKISMHVSKYPECLTKTMRCQIQFNSWSSSDDDSELYRYYSFTGTPYQIASHKGYNAIRTHLKMISSSIGENTGMMINVKEPLDGSVYDIYKLIFMIDNIDLLDAHLQKYPDAIELKAYCYNIGKQGHAFAGNPLTVAACVSRYSSYGIIKRLLAAQKIKSNKTTHDIITYVACKINDTSSFDTLKLLLDNGYSVDPSDKHQPSVLTILCYNLHDINGVTHIEEILKYKPNVDAQCVGYNNCEPSCVCRLLCGKTALAILSENASHNHASYRVIAKKIIENYCVQLYKEKK